MLRRQIAIVVVLCAIAGPAPACQRFFEDPSWSRSCLLDEGGVVQLMDAAPIGDRCDGCSDGYKVCIRAMPGVIVPQAPSVDVVIHGSHPTPLIIRKR